MKKLFISADLEGTTGITHWGETEIGGYMYNYFTAQMTREVAAACEGAISQGFEDILVRTPTIPAAILILPSCLSRHAFSVPGAAILIL